MKRPSLPTVLSATALFFSLAGAGLAADRYIITSTSQIKPSVLRNLESRGSAGPKGERGPAGAQGATGAQGLEGSSGAAAASGPLPAGFSTTSPGVSLPTDDSPVTVASLSLPAGSFITNATVDLDVIGPEGPTWQLNCTLTDAPHNGDPGTSVTQSWVTVPNGNFPLISGQESTTDLPFTLAVSSPTSPSTLSVSCDAGELSPVGHPFVNAGQTTLTAVQTSGNS
jgi:hypothetical protein